MKIGIVGAGAVGGLLASRLSSCADVSVLARGATLSALQQRGIRVQCRDSITTTTVRCSGDACEIGVQDVVVIAVKAPAMTTLAPSLAPMIGPQTVVLPAMNGVPWWFCRGIRGFESPLSSIDPQDVIGRALPIDNVLGCVVHLSACVREPGLIDHTMGQRLIVGEPFGGESERVGALAAVLSRAGFEVEVSLRIRDAIWFKLWGNLTMNPVSALTGACIDQVLDDGLVRALCSRAMREAALIGQRLGCVIDQSADDRHAVTAKLGAFKTSMLQDAEAGRALELDAIVGVVHEMGQTLALETPAIDAIFGLTRLMARQRGLYPAASTDTAS